MPQMRQSRHIRAVSHDFSDNKDGSDENNSQERQILKYFGRFGAWLVDALAAVSIWFPSFDPEVDFPCLGGHLHLGRWRL
jgi:hypothetical protein